MHYFELTLNYPFAVADMFSHALIGVFDFNRNSIVTQNGK
jgi:hypothetical protein